MSLTAQNNMLVTNARKKYNAGTFRGGDDGNEFELLNLDGFKISGVDFHAQPLTNGVQSIKVMFPPKQVLALNGRTTWKRTCCISPHTTTWILAILSV